MNIEQKKTTNQIHLENTKILALIFIFIIFLFKIQTDIES